METSANNEQKGKYVFKIRRNDFTIDEKSISYGNKTLNCEKIVKLKYGSTQLYVNGIKANRIYEFVFEDTNGKRLRISFQRLWIKTKDGEALYNEIIQAVWVHITSKITNKMLADLKKGEKVNVGKFEIDKKGIQIMTWSWSKFKNVPVFIPWNSCLKENSMGGLVISSRENKRHKCRQQFLQVWNLNALHSLLDFLWEGGRCFLLEKGEL